MSEPEHPSTDVPSALTDCFVRYDELRPCTTAFIDTRTPGSEKKENFTIIGPGVSESPDQHVHINVPHGFNIGAARQPPGCINSQHSHETAEVFFVHSGTWAFTLGEKATDGTVVLHPGDTISIPTQVFRGFENVGDDTGLIFAVLGGDDPGHVMWAPDVFERAATYGLILLDDGSLVDTTRGEAVPEGKTPQAPTSAEQVAALRSMTADDLAACVVSQDGMTWRAARAAVQGVEEAAIIGMGNRDIREPAAPLDWSHGFCAVRMRVASDGTTQWHRRDEEEVIIVHRGQLSVHTADGALELRQGDVLTVPPGMMRKFCGTGQAAADAFVVRRGDCPQPLHLES
jgi:quercetin dioxygenase-like cupin family protein